MQKQGSEQGKKVNVWDYKPWWCQPWSIILTGIIAIASSWFALHRLWLSGLVALPIGAWWVYFLILYPRAIANAYSNPD